MGGSLDSPVVFTYGVRCFGMILVFLLSFGTLMTLRSSVCDVQLMGASAVQKEKVATSTIASSSLACYQQSLGFFDNIDDSDWKARRERARALSTNRKGGAVTKRTKPNQWYLRNYYPIFTCPHQMRVGGWGDGPKWTCDPERIPRAAQERGESCLVYSVGCAGRYDFEDGLVSLLGAHACEIHVFDLSRDFTRKNDVEHKNIHFHYWGLGSSYYTEDRKEEFTYLTLKETMEKLGHTNRTIDIFKIDCEGCEWTTYKDWIGSDVDIRQLQIETHYTPIVNGVQPSVFFDDIQLAGFAMFSKEANIHPHVMGNCVEWSFVKLHPDFFNASDDTT